MLQGVDHQLSEVLGVGLTYGLEEEKGRLVMPYSVNRIVDLRVVHGGKAFDAKEIVRAPRVES